MITSTFTSAEELATTSELIDCISAHNVRSSILSTRKNTGSWSNFWEQELDNNKSRQDALVAHFNVILQGETEAGTEILRKTLSYTAHVKLTEYKQLISEFGLQKAEKEILSETWQCQKSLIHKSSVSSVSPPTGIAI